MTDLTAALSDFIIRSSSADFPEGALDKAKKVIVDTFAAILASADSEVALPLLRYVHESGASGDSPILGTGVTATPELATLVNGTFGAALEFDDVLPVMPGHPSAIIVPPLFADTWASRLSGQEFIEAYVIGLEVGAKIAVGITFGHYQRGHHATGTLGIFSALGALAKRYRLDRATVATAFGIAASTASGLSRNFGTMTKPLHSGWAARSAFASVQLAHCGFTAAADVLEGEFGFFAAYGVPESDPQASIDTLGKPWVIMEPGVTLKKFPCCRAAHRAMDGLLQLRTSLGLSAENLERIECRVAPGVLVPLRYPAPKNGLEAKFSMPYALAAGVLDGEYTLSTFTDEAVNRPAIGNLYKKIQVREDPRCKGSDPLVEKHSYGARGVVEVEVWTTDGRTATATIERQPGHPSRALTWDEMRNKFISCAERARIDPAAVERAFSILYDLEHCGDIQEVIALIARPRGATVATL